jgi:AcrR family transcriptional regulator
MDPLLPVPQPPACLYAAMTSRRLPQISSRKQPQQARSTELVAAILQAAVKVLTEEGANRFTTARVAEKAGVSVGSVYQYFPNKAAILFRLQADEWEQTAAMFRNILEDVAKSPLDRLRTLVHAFIRSECEEARMRVALNDAAPLYRNAPEAQQARAAAHRTIDLFMKELLPKVPKATRTLAGDLITTTFSAVGTSFSETPRTQAQIKAYTDAMADMFCAYVKDLQRSHDERVGRPLQRI